MRYSKFLFIFILILSASGCLLHPPYDKAAIVFYNKTPDILSYSIYSANDWSILTKIKSDGADFVMLYDIIDTDDVPPKYFNMIKIVTPKCKIKLDRNEVEKSFVRDPDGRKGWNLYINRKLLKNFGCNKS